MRIAVVRHGQAAPKRSWTGADDDRPLTGRGRRQAEGLAELLGAGPTRLITSPAVRCRQTVEPVSRRCGRDVEVSASLARDAGAVAAELIRDLVSVASGHQIIVLCTHREVIAEAFPMLVEPGGVKLGHRLPGAKGGVWLLEFRAKRLKQVHYRAPRVPASA